MEFVSILIVYPGICGLSGMFCGYSSNFCLKLVMEHPVWPRIFNGRLLKSCGPLIWRLPSLIAIILPDVHYFVWRTWHRRPYRVDVYYFIRTFGSVPSRIFQVYINRCLSILLSWEYILRAIVDPSKYLRYWIYLMENDLKRDKIFWISPTLCGVHSWEQ